MSDKEINNTFTPRQIRRGTKLYRVLKALADGHSYNRFEAERALNDHCLHSTISTIEKLGIEVDRKFEKVPCLRGAETTEVMRYWFRDESIYKSHLTLEAAR